MITQYFLLSLTGILCCSSTIFAANFSLTKTFNDPTVTQNDQFGIDVAIDGNYVLIGARLDETKGRDVGQAHLFDAVTGNLLQTFDNPSISRGGNFGLSVDVKGNRVLVGASEDGTNGGQVGRAYLFDALSGDLLLTFDDPTITSGDRFGRSVALSENHVLIGAIGHDAEFPDVGEAHLFSALTGELLQTFSDPSSSFGGDGFGQSVAIDGNHVLIGERLQDFQAKAHLFDALTGERIRTFSSEPSRFTSNIRGGSGVAVAIDGNHVLIGDPLVDREGENVGRAFLFDINTGNRLHTFIDPSITAGDVFGRSVALSGDQVLIGAPGDDTNGLDIGQVHLYDAESGSLIQTFNDPTVTERDGFGWSVAIDGDSVLIGAFVDDTLGPAVGQAYLFETVPEPSTNVICLGLIFLARISTRLSNSCY